MWDGLRVLIRNIENLIQALRTHRSLGIIANLVIAMVAATALGACSVDHSSAESKAASAATQTVPVVVADVLRKTVPVRAQGIGNVESLATVAVKSRIDGQIVKVDFRDGAQVKQGQILFEIDPRPAIAQLKQAQAKLASDLAQLAHAQEQDKRYQDLLQKKFISQDAYAQYKTNLDSAQANVDADHAAVESTRLQVEFATIRAPISGRAGKIMIPQGNLVKANDTNP
ncbi:MAG: efflux RND transporter periplasmic adaptor subunit, partial [Giesbergeria sp.]